MADENNILSFATLESFTAVQDSGQNSVSLVYQTQEINNSTLENNNPNDSQFEENGHNVGSTNKEILLCNICNYQTDNKFLLQRHVKLHNIDKPFKCPHCDREFRDSLQMTNHVNIHLGFKPYRCDRCELSFTTRGELVRHTRYRHTLEKPHKCPHCEYASVELSKLKRHIRTHTGERPYLCPHCDYASRDTFKLKRHIRVHTGEKPYECPICHNRFTQSNSLKSHLLIHRGVSMVSGFKCKYCASKFDSQNELDNHIKLNHKEGDEIIVPDGVDIQPTPEITEIEILQKHQQQIESQISTWYYCNECPMKFSTKETLENHKIKHTGERPFQCHLCGIGFGQQFALRAHLYSHNRDNTEEKNNTTASSISHDFALQKDESLVMDKLKEIIDNVVEIVNPNEHTLYENNKISILSIRPVQCDEEIIKNLMNNMISKVVEMLQPNENKSKSSSIARLLNSIPAKSHNYGFLTTKVYQVEDQTDLCLLNKDTAKLPIIPSLHDVLSSTVTSNYSPIVISSDEPISSNKSTDDLLINIPDNPTKIIKPSASNSELKSLKAEITLESENKKKKKEYSKKADPYGISCQICAAIFRNKANLTRHLKKFHKSEDTESTPDKNRHDFFLSHLNETALNQNYNGISKSHELKLNKTNNTNNTNNDKNKTTTETVVNENDETESANVSNCMDQELLFSRNESYSELVKDITVLTKKAKKRSITTPKKSPKQQNLPRTDKSSAHLAPLKPTEESNNTPDEIKTPSRKKRCRNTTKETPDPKTISKRGKKSKIERKDEEDDEDDISSNVEPSKETPKKLPSVVKRLKKETKNEVDDDISDIRTKADIEVSKNVVPPKEPVRRENRREASKRAKLNISNMIMDSSLNDEFL